MSSKREKEPEFSVRVVNVRGWRPETMPQVRYVGRQTGPWVGSPLGNPVHLAHTADATARFAAVKQYHAWLSSKLYEQFLSTSVVHSASCANEQAAAFQRLCEIVIITGGVTLGCWCAPKLCHAHVLQYEIMQRCGSPWDEHIEKTPWAMHLTSLTAPAPVVIEAAPVQLSLL